MVKPVEIEVAASAVLSADGRYRYELTRRWGVGPLVTFVMLNPSTADSTINDPTIRRCMGFARTWGFPGLAVVNLYAWRSPSPQDLWTAEDPVGAKNDDYLTRAAAQGGPLIAAWGNNAKTDRVSHVLTLPGFFEVAEILGLTKQGQPRHPLYLRSDTPRIRLRTTREKARDDGK